MEKSFITLAPGIESIRMLLSMMDSVGIVFVITKVELNPRCSFNLILTVWFQDFNLCNSPSVEFIVTVRLKPIGRKEKSVRNT